MNKSIITKFVQVYQIAFPEWVQGKYSYYHYTKIHLVKEVEIVIVLLYEWTSSFKYSIHKLAWSTVKISLYFYLKKYSGAGGLRKNRSGSK